MSERMTSYDACGWRRLPSDRTADEFLTIYHETMKRRRKPSQPFFLKCLENVELFNSNNILVNQIFPHKVPEERDANNRYPNLIPWEVEDLLTTILQTRDESSKCEGAAYSDAIFQKLASKIEESLGCDISQDFIALHYLNNVYIQDKLLQSFRGEFSKRLKLLDEYIFCKESGVDIKTLTMALARLDVLISELEDRDKVLPSSTQALYTLFDNLLSIRKELVPERDCRGGAKNYHWNSHSDPELRAILLEQIEKTERNRSEEKRGKFLENYKEYLLQLLPNTVKENAQSFWSEFQLLYEYFYEEEDTHRLEQNIREEFHRFARDIFRDLENVDVFEYSYTDYQPRYAQSAFVRYRIADYHRDIQMKIHSALRLIRMVNTQLFYLGFDKIDSKTRVFLRNILNRLYFTGLIQTHDNDIEDALGWTAFQRTFPVLFERVLNLECGMIEKIKYFSAKYPEIPNVEDITPSWVEDFLVVCKRYTDPIFPDQELFSKILPESIQFKSLASDPTEPFAKLHPYSFLLTLVCKTVVALEIERDVPAIVEEYSQMRGRLSK